MGSSHVLDGRGGNHGLGQQLGGGGDRGVGDGVGDHLGGGVGDLGDSVGGGGHGGVGVGDRGSDRGGGVGVGDRGDMGVLNRGRGHNNSLADGVNKAVLVEVLGEALEGQGAKALRGLDSISKGRGQGTDRDTLVDMGGGGSKGAGKDGGQDLQKLFR